MIRTAIPDMAEVEALLVQAIDTAERSGEPTVAAQIAQALDRLRALPRPDIVDPSARSGRKGDFALLLDRAVDLHRQHGADADLEVLRRIERAIRTDRDPLCIRDLDHLLQLMSFRDRVTAARQGDPV